ncbi:unnamed protein product [Arctogadus glacialis]
MYCMFIYLFDVGLFIGRTNIGYNVIFMYSIFYINTECNIMIVSALFIFTYVESAYMLPPALCMGKTKYPLYLVNLMRVYGPILPQNNTGSSV